MQKYNIMRNKIIIKKAFFILTIYLYVSSSFAQIGQWALPPNQINFFVGNPSSTSIPNGYNSSYYSSEAAYDDSGNLLFYVILSENNKKSVYKPGSSNPIGELNSMGGYYAPGEQCIITKVPNSSNKYYIIYSVKEIYLNGKIGYSIVECNGGAVTIIENGTEIAPIYSFDGKTIVEINSNKYLYFTHYNGAVYRCLIGSNGISGVTTILSTNTPNVNLNNYEFETNNLESSLDGRKLAWINFWDYNSGYSNSEIIVVDLDVNGDYSSYQTFFVDKNVYGKVRGIEFTTEEENDVIYFSASEYNIDGNIYKLSLTDGSIQPLATAAEFGNTCIQTASDGNIYVVSNDGSHLGRILPNSNSFESNVLSVTINSNAEVLNYNTYGDPIYHLPSNFSYTPLSLAYSMIYESCAWESDGSIEVIPSGGVPPYQYQWDDPQNQTTALVSGLTQGEYTCTVTDAFGRVKSISVELLTNPALFNYSGPYEINSNITWSGDHFKVDRMIHINNGGSLTLTNGAKVEFNAHAGFIVHDGGKLNFTDNVELSGLEACGYNIWSGITVMDNGYVKGHSFSIRDCESEVQAGGTMHINENASIVLIDECNIIVRNGGYICIAPTAHIELSTIDTEFELKDGFLFGVNPNLNITPTPNCSDDPCDWNVTGIGSFYINENYTHLDNIIIQQNTTESYDNVDWTLKRNIILEANSELTIDNSIIRLSKTSKIIVKQGAKLIVDNTTFDRLQSCLVPYWLGIEVWGNKDEGQTEEFQGKLVLNGTTIEHAHEAVQLWNPDHYNTSGGMISAINTIFRNNHRAVSFLAYKNIRFGVEWNYESSFKQCTFENNTNYDMDNPFTSFITMWKVRGVHFTACDFINSSEFPDGKAIYTLDAGYKFKGECTGVVGPNGECISGWETNNFTSFIKAIESANTPDPTIIPYAINITDSYFYDNQYGIYMTTVDNAATMLNNEFKIGNNGAINFEKAQCGYFSARGIQMNQSFGFTIEENNFEKMQGSSSGNDIVGVLVSDCPIVLDDIYLNEFTDLTAGNQADGYNRLVSTNDNHGVTYLCNENINNTIDIFIADNSMITGHVGSSQKAAGNKFSTTNPQIQNNFTQEVNYYWFNQPNEELEYYSDYVTPIQVYNNNECLSNFGGGNGNDPKLILTSEEKAAVEQEFYQNYQDYNSVADLLEQLKDGGSTETTNLSIATAQPSDTWELRSNLLGKSPYLSKEVLMEASDRTDVLPESVLFEILSANPDELRKTDLMDHLENKQQPLPNYMINILKQMATGVSAKTALIGQKAQAFTTKTKAAQSMIRSIKNEDQLNIQALRNWLGNMENIAADKQIIGTYLYEENYTAANNLLDLIPNLYNLEGEKLQDFNDYKDLLNLQINLKQEDRNIFTLNDSEKTQLLAFAENSTGDAKYGARSILSFVYGDNYCDCITPIEGSGNKSSSYVYSQDDMAKAMGLSLNAKPSPAMTYTSVDFTLPIGIERAELQLINIEGKIIYSQKVSGMQGQVTLDIRYYKSGAYIFRLQAEEYIVSKSIIIQ